MSKENAKKKKKSKEERTRQVCILGLLVIMVIGSAGFAANYFLGGQADQQTDSTKFARVVIVFNETAIVQRDLVLNESINALQAFEKIGNVTVELNEFAEAVVVNVETKKHAHANNETHNWQFYVNGNIEFEPVDTIIVQDQQTLILAFGERLF